MLLIEMFSWAKVAYVFLTLNTIFIGFNVGETRLIMGLTLNNFANQSWKYSPHINFSFFDNAYSLLSEDRYSINDFVSNSDLSLQIVIHFG